MESRSPLPKFNSSPRPDRRRSAKTAAKDYSRTLDGARADRRDDATKARKYFLDYQLRWLADYSRIKIWEKSRRIGATYVQSYEDVRDILSKREYTAGRPVTKVFFTSADESAAREYIDYCAMWARAANAIAESIKTVVLDSEKDINALCIEFKNGGKIYALTSNPKRFRSKGGKVVIDEFAYHEDQKALWKAAKPTAMWGYPIRILSTHNGKQCLYYKFVETSRKDKNGKSKTGWSLHTTTIYDAVNDGLVDKILGRESTEQERKDWLEQERKDCQDEDDWNEEYLCNAIDATTAFIPWEFITACESPDILMTMEELAELTEGDLYAGWDVARTKDLSVFWIVQKLGDVIYTRHVEAFAKTKYKIQEDYLDQALALPLMRRICIDQTGIGHPLTEFAQDKHGAYRVEGVTFTNSSKELLAVDAKNALEDLRARIPEDQTVRDSFHSIKKATTGAGNVRYDADRTEATGHADHWWAFALARHASKTATGPTFVASRKRTAKNRITSGF